MVFVMAPLVVGVVEGRSEVILPAVSDARRPCLVILDEQRLSNYFDSVVKEES